MLLAAFLENRRGVVPGFIGCDDLDPAQDLAMRVPVFFAKLVPRFHSAVRPHEQHNQGRTVARDLQAESAAMRLAKRQGAGTCETLVLPGNCQAVFSNFQLS